MGKSWMRRLQAYTSGIGWATYLTKFLDRAVQRKTVVAFGVAEAVICVTMAVYLLKARAISELVRFPLIHSFRILTAILFFRIFSGIFGAVAAFTRKTSLVRYYWCFLIFNTFTTVAISITFKRARCNCTNYWQCQVLFGYMGAEKYTMINPYPPPDEERFQKIRAVPYVVPPVPLGEAEQKWIEQKTQRRQSLVNPVKPQKKQAAAGPTLLQTLDNKLEPVQVSPWEPATNSAETMKAISSSMMEHSESSKRFWRKARALKASNFGSGVLQVSNDNLSSVAVSEGNRSNSVGLITIREDAYAKGASLRLCCLVVQKFNMVPHRDMGDAPAKVREWWDKKNCESIVKDAAQCEKLLSKPADSKEVQSMPANVTNMIPDSTMKFFSFSKKGIAWESANFNKCRHYSEADVGQFSLLHDAMLSIRDKRPPKHPAKTQEFFETIIGSLNHCTRRVFCGVLAVHLKAKGTEGNKEGILQVCKLKFPVVPVPAKPPDAKGDVSLFFQYNRKAADFTGQQSQKDRSGSGLMKTVLSVPVKEGKAKVVGHFLDSCRCRPHQDSGEEGCQAFYENGIPHHWCEVSSMSVPVCQQLGMKMFQLGNDASRYWTADLCRRSSCRCSGIGMTSTTMALADPNVIANVTPSNASRGTTGGHELMYGTQCKNWNKKDTNAWCYVGYDSTCPDRQKVNSNIVIPPHLQASDTPGSVSQYKSTFACVRTDQQNAFYEKKDRCQLYVAIPVGLSAILTIASVMMIVVVYKFLVRRCGDHFAIEAEFVPYFSDGSEDDHEDDFDVKRSMAPPPVPEDGCGSFVNEGSEDCNFVSEGAEERDRDS